MAKIGDVSSSREEFAPTGKKNLLCERIDAVIMPVITRPAHTMRRLWIQNHPPMKPSEKKFFFRPFRSYFAVDEDV